MGSIFARREPFGGVLYRDGKMRFLNPSAFAICVGMAQKLSDDSIVRNILEEFEVDDPDIIRADIIRLRRELLSDGGWTATHGVKAGETEIPTLSAPLEIHWEVTGKCNLACQHCYNDSGPHASQPSLGNILSVVKELRDNKIKLRGVIVSGGEPLMRRDIYQVTAAIREITEELVLATNGTLITSRNINWIARCYDAINLSIDSHKKDSFAAFRGRKDISDKVERAISLCRANSVPVIAQTTLSKYNVDDLEEMAEYLKSREISAWIVRVPIWIGRAPANADKFLTNRELRKYRETFEKLKRDYGEYFHPLNIGTRFDWAEAPFEKTGEADGVIACAAGTMLATIRADGTMVPCSLFGGTSDSRVHSKPVWGGNLLSEWRTAEGFRNMRRVSLKKISPCNSCRKLSSLCDGGCRAIAFQAFGAVEAPDPTCDYVMAH